MNYKWLSILIAVLPSNLPGSTDCISVSGSTYYLTSVNFDQTTVLNGTALLLPTGTIEPIPSIKNSKIAGQWTWGWPQFEPGQGGVFITVRSVSVCFSNSVTPILPLPRRPGYSLVCCQTNGPATFEAIMGRSPDSGTKVYRLRPGGMPIAFNGTNFYFIGFNETNYFIYTFTDGTWSPEAPVAGVAEAV